MCPSPISSFSGILNFFEAPRSHGGQGLWEGSSLQMVLGNVYGGHPNRVKDSN